MKLTTLASLGLGALTLTACGSAKEISKAIADGQEASKAASESTDTAQIQDPKASALRTFSVTPAGCKASDSRLFKTPSGLFHLVLAQCAGTSQVYGLRTNIEGTPAAAHSLLTNCRHGVVSFSAAQGPDSFLLSATCGGTGTYVTNAQEVLENGHKGEPREIRRLTGIADHAIFEGKLAFNPESGTYGYAARGLFLQIEATGELTGGPVKLDDATVVDFRVQGGRFEILQGGGLHPVTFSAISAFGIPEDLTKPLDGHPEGSNSADKAVFGGADEVLTYGGNARAWRVTTHKNGLADPAPALNQGDAPAALLDAKVIDAAHLGVLSRKDGSLLYGVVQTEGAQRIVSQRPIGGSEVQAAALSIFGEKAFASMTKNGKAVVTILPSK